MPVVTGRSVPAPPPGKEDHHGDKDEDHCETQKPLPDLATLNISAPSPASTLSTTPAADTPNADTPTVDDNEKMVYRTAAIETGVPAPVRAAVVEALKGVCSVGDIICVQQQPGEWQVVFKDMKSFERFVGLETLEICEKSWTIRRVAVLTSDGRHQWVRAAKKYDLDSYTQKELYGEIEEYYGDDY